MDEGVFVEFHPLGLVSLATGDHVGPGLVQASGPFQAQLRLRIGDRRYLVARIAAAAGRATFEDLRGAARADPSTQ